MTLQCEICGKEHDDWPPDKGFRRPDIVWNMSPEERARRVKENDDLCEIDGQRHFIRAVLLIPLNGRSEKWGIGLWAEVSNRDFSRYLELYSTDASGEKPFPGTIANDLDIFPHTSGTRVLVQLGTASQRPTLAVSDRFSALGKIQRHGLSDQHLHDLLAAGPEAGRAAS